MSTLEVDKIQGVATAGSVSVTGEGNSTTTNLQQGLVKNWLESPGDATFSDSFNCSGGTDHSAGQYTYAFTNNMNAANYSLQCTCHSGAIVEADANNQTASNYKLQCFTRPALDAFSDVVNFTMVSGDLA